MNKLLMSLLLIFLSSSVCLAMSTPPALIDFTPTKFDVLCDRPLYIYEDNTIFYSKSGDLFDKSMPVWHGDGTVPYVYVSPNSKYILVINKNSLSIIDDSGKPLGSISPVRSIYDANNRMGETFYRERGIQWSADSKSFYIIKDIFYESKGSQLFSDKAELQQFDINKKSLKTIIASFMSDEYFFSADGDIVYFSVPTGKGDLELKSYLISSGILSPEMGNLKSLNNKTAKNNSFFCNIDAHWTDNFGDSYKVISFDGMSYVKIKGTELFGEKAKTPVNGGFYYCRGDICKPLIVVQDGYNPMYSNYYNEDLNAAYFLPGNRYFIMSIESKQYNGQAVVDLLTMKYLIIPKAYKDFIVFFALTTKDIPRLDTSNAGLNTPVYQWQQAEKNI